MSISVLMPALSPTMTEGKLAKWHVKVGDAVKSGQVICEIETDKATMEVEAVDEGTVAQLLVAEGQLFGRRVAVGAEAGALEQRFGSAHRIPLRCVARGTRPEWEVVADPG